MPTKADKGSWWVKCIISQTTATSKTKGTPNPSQTALKPVCCEATTVTSSPTWGIVGGRWNTSTVFCLLSEALQWRAALHWEQAAVCIILTRITFPSTESTIPLCLILVLFMISEGGLPSILPCGVCKCKGNTIIQKCQSFALQFDYSLTNLIRKRFHLSSHSPMAEQG